MYQSLFYIKIDKNIKYKWGWLLEKNIIILVFNFLYSHHYWDSYSEANLTTTACYFLHPIGGCSTICCERSKLQGIMGSATFILLNNTEIKHIEFSKDKTVD